METAHSLAIQNPVVVPDPSRDPVTVYLAGLAPSSRRSMLEALELLGEILAGEKVDARAIPWQRLTSSETLALRAKLVERSYAPSYASKILCALRGVLKTCWRLRLMSSEDYHRAADVEPIRGSRVAAGRDATADELRKLFEATRSDEKHTRGLRDAALLSLAYGAGLRRHEIAKLDIFAFDPERGELRVIGKGNKERVIPLPRWAVENLKGWIRERGATPGGLICPVDRLEDRVRSYEHVSGQAIYQSLSRLVEKAGVESLTPHDFRRSYATTLLDATGDLVATQHLLGHSSPTTTERYLKGIERQKKRAASALPDPESS